MGFYRHDQRGAACLADDTRILTVVFFFGVILVSGFTSIRANKAIKINKMQCSSTWLYWWYWCDLASICIKLIEVDLKMNSNSNFKCSSNYIKLHLLVFVFCNSNDHVCDKLLKCRCSSLHFKSSSWNCNWIKFKLIPFKIK